MIAARQELDLRPQLERLDSLICWSEDIDEGALSFAFRPLWQLDEPAKAALALSRAQTTQIYAGLKLWPDAVMARLAEAQLVQDGTYPNAAAVFTEAGAAVTDAREVGEIPRASGNFWPEGDEPRDWHGRWTAVGRGAPLPDSPVRVAASHIDPFAGGNPDINQKIDQEEKEQEHASAIAPRPDPENPIDVIQMTLQPLGRAGAGSTPQIPSAAGATTQSGVPLTLAAPKLAGVPSASGLPTSSGRSPIQVEPGSPPYFPEFEDSPIYKFFDDRFTATPDELMALKLQMPDDIARHMIDGFIGPGPFAQEPVYLGTTGKFTDEMTYYNDLIGYGFGCHQCGSRDPGTESLTQKPISARVAGCRTGWRPE